MNDEELKALFERDAADDRRPNPAAKRRAIEAAMKEFDAVSASVLSNAQENSNSSQGLFSRLRLMATNMKKAEDESMRRTSQPWILGGMATAIVAIFGVLIIDFQSTNRGDTNGFLDEADGVIGKEVAVNLPALESKIGPNAVEEEIVATELRASEPAPENLAASDMALSKHDAAASALAASAPNNTFVNAKLSRSRLASPEIQSPFPQSDYADAYTSELVDLPHDQPQQNRDQFEDIEINAIKRVDEEPVSTFSIDVDTASYSFVRSALNEARLPPKNAVRIEEMLNYFDYDYPQPTSSSEPFASTVTVIDSPWAEGKKLMHIGIKGYDLIPSEQPSSNLVFLLDVSGSMNAANKLPLVKQSMNMLLSTLKPSDTVAMVVYAGAAGTVLEPTPVKDKSKILAAISRLNAGGSTAGAQGIELAYQLAEANFDKAAVNRIILATDGDFNVGITDREQLKGFIERKREKGIFLSVLGFGRGNYNDHLMQELAQNGNGVAAYIDSVSEAQKVLVDEATSTLFPIAKDVKIQVEFNPASVAEYRLIGYETRALKREDFNNDKVDAGDIGAGHTVTALYEFTPVGGEQSIDSLRYQKTKPAVSAPASEYAFLKLRYKLPDEDTSKLVTTPVASSNTNLNKQSGLLREVHFSVAVAGFAQLLKNPKYLGDWDYEHALELAQANRGDDPYGYRAEFVQLIRKAQVSKEI